MSRAKLTPAGRSAPAADGRLRRTERSREAIVRALFDLVHQGDLQPSAHRVAERAGVGIRTVFRHFAEMDTLFAEMSERLLATVRPLDAEGPPAGSLPERVSALVRRRFALFERIAPYKRSADLQRWRSRFLQNRHQATVRSLREELLEWLPELEDATDALVDALEAALSFEAWNRLRSDQGLSGPRAQAAVEMMALALARSLRRQPGREGARAQSSRSGRNAKPGVGGRRSQP